MTKLAIDTNQIHSHSDTEFCDRRALAATVGVPFKENTGSSFRGSSTVSSRTLEQTRDPTRKLPARTPTVVREQQRDRIRSISLDMNALNRSCSVEMATSSARLSLRRPAVRLRAPVQRRRHGGPAPQQGGSNEPQRKGRAETSGEGGGLSKRSCSDTIGESSSVDDARRKRPRSNRKSQYSCLTHLQSDTSLHFHIATSQCARFVFQ